MLCRLLRIAELEPGISDFVMRFRIAFIALEKLIEYRYGVPKLSLFSENARELAKELHRVRGDLERPPIFQLRFFKTAFVCKEDGEIAVNNHVVRCQLERGSKILFRFGWLVQPSQDQRQKRIVVSGIRIISNSIACIEGSFG